jgi:hypothetical protein
MPGCCFLSWESIFLQHRSLFASVNNPKNHLFTEAIIQKGGGKVPFDALATHLSQF